MTEGKMQHVPLEDLVKQRIRPVLAIPGALCLCFIPVTEELSSSIVSR